MNFNEFMEYVELSEDSQLRLSDILRIYENYGEGLEEDFIRNLIRTSFYKGYFSAVYESKGEIHE